MNTIFFTGNLGRDAETRSTQSGDVCSFSVAVRQGFNRDAPSEWYRCSIWGQRGQSLMTHLKKGAKVAVVGELSIGQYEGKPQYNVRVAEIDPFCGGKTEPERGEAKKPYDSGGGTSTGFDADLDDSDVPF
jgi:single-strand DNA-binding protein